MAKKKKLPAVHSLGELRRLANTDKRYAKLLLCAASNLGGTFKDDDIDKAYRVLLDNAMETDEDGIVGEVNFCRDLV